MKNRISVGCLAAACIFVALPVRAGPPTASSNPPQNSASSAQAALPNRHVGPVSRATQSPQNSSAGQSKILPYGGLPGETPIDQLRRNAGSSSPSSSSGTRSGIGARTDIRQSDAAIYASQVNADIRARAAANTATVEQFNANLIAAGQRLNQQLDDQRAATNAAIRADAERIAGLSSSTPAYVGGEPDGQGRVVRPTEAGAPPYDGYNVSPEAVKYRDEGARARAAAGVQDKEFVRERQSLNDGIDESTNWRIGEVLGGVGGLGKVASVFTPPGVQGGLGLFESGATAVSENATSLDAASATKKFADAGAGLLADGLREPVKAYGAAAGVGIGGLKVAAKLKDGYSDAALEAIRTFGDTAAKDAANVAGGVKKVVNAAAGVAESNAQIGHFQDALLARTAQVEQNRQRLERKDAALETKAMDADLKELQRRKTDDKAASDLQAALLERVVQTRPTSSP